MEYRLITLKKKLAILYVALKIKANNNIKRKSVIEKLQAFLFRGCRQFWRGKMLKV
jgi:hypothetical protein